MQTGGDKNDLCCQPAARYRAGKHKRNEDSHDGQRVLEGLCIQRGAS